MALKLEFLDANGNPTGQYVSTGDMTLPLQTTHWMNLGDGRDVAVVKVRVVNDDPTNYEYYNVVLDASDTDPAAGASTSWFTFRFVGDTTWLASLAVGTVLTNSNAIEVKVQPPSTTSAGTYTDVKLRLTYDELDLNA
ncbi:MAG: hypothetical protein AB1330_01150 [Bacillota bacterium]